MAGETSKTGLVVLPASTRIRSKFRTACEKTDRLVAPSNIQSANGKAIGIR
jgi:hypothetical protein